MALSEVEIVKISSKAAVEATLKKLNEEKLKELKQKKDRCLKNTKMLLQHYRAFKEQSGRSIYKASQIDENVIDIITLMWDPKKRKELTVESIKSSALRTCIMVTHIDEMLAAYKQLAECSKKPEELRRYNALYDKYISENELSTDEIAEKYGVEPRTIYNDIIFAQNTLSAFLYGIDYTENIT